MSECCIASYCTRELHQLEIVPVNWIFRFFGVSDCQMFSLPDFEASQIFMQLIRNETSIFGSKNQKGKLTLSS